jgi:hypothetical protein
LDGGGEKEKVTLVVSSLRFASQAAVAKNQSGWSSTQSAARVAILRPAADKFLRDEPVWY